MAGIDCKTGKEVWHTPNPDNWKMSHSSIMPMVFEGKKMYVYFAVGGLCGISAQGRDKGQLLWKTNVFNPSVIAPSPVILDKGRIFMTAGYGAGAILFQLVKEGERFSVKVIQQYKPTEGLASEQQTPVYFNHCLFAILPKDAGAGRNQFVCCKDNDCTKFVWTSSKTDRYGLGPYIMADGKFFILSDEGEITIAKVSTTSFIFLDKAKILDGQDAWGPMAIADGRLIMRDAKHLVCIDVRAN
jgi:outer membrane protein assembly factor BamB